MEGVNIVEKKELKSLARVSMTDWYVCVMATGYSQDADSEEHSAAHTTRGKEKADSVVGPGTKTTHKGPVWILEPLADGLAVWITGHSFVKCASREWT
ncbi:hypothetical protein NDU88_003932 [Pleurodeles waltl]|uniref:Uncharacterized protein n=1 Tax=Pleurodeles waltl TaxID=8319 RepID=A0AAV7WSM6_PLEWA|nr:hypothetical protein NDU88_003932 [Pleurodeles waltl]